MVIQYHGDACVRLAGKHSAGEFAVLLDPYDAKATGLKVLRPSSVDLVASTTGVLPAFEAGPLRVAGPGEYEAKGVMVTGIAVGATTIYRLNAEGLSLVHLGNVNAAVSDALIDQIGDVDVCIVPIGGHGTLTAKQAAEIIERIEPRLVIPIQYKVPGAKIPYDGPEAFCKEVGCPAKATEEKIRVTKKDLPTEEMWVRMLVVS